MVTKIFIETKIIFEPHKYMDNLDSFYLGYKQLGYVIEYE